MQQRIREARKSHDGGFTLIELLIVIVVLGILATIVVFGVAQFQKDAERSACESDVKTVQVAVSAYQAQKKGVVPTIDQLIASKILRTDPNEGRKEGEPAIQIGADGLVVAAPVCSTLG